MKNGDTRLQSDIDNIFVAVCHFECRLYLKPLHQAKYESQPKLWSEDVKHDFLISGEFVTILRGILLV